jgi:hypothetical protein
VIRQAITVVNPTAPIIGSWVAAQTTAIASSSHRVCTRLAINPPIIAEIENRKKKLDPTSPNCRGVRSSPALRLLRSASKCFLRKGADPGLY